MPATDAISDEEAFHSSYRIFLNALEMLSGSPEQQCEAMGDFNVAWELKGDVCAGRYLLNRGYLSAEQEAWIAAMAGVLEAVPAQVLPAGAGRQINLIAMRHPSWVPARVIAAHVLHALEPFTAVNSIYLRLS